MTTVSPSPRSSPNVFDKESPRKRSHDEYSEVTGQKPRKDGDEAASVASVGVNHSKIKEDTCPTTPQRASPETSFIPDVISSRSASTVSENPPPSTSPTSTTDDKMVPKKPVAPPAASIPQQKIKRQRLTAEEKEAKAKEAEEKRRIAVEKAEERRRIQEEKKREAEEKKRESDEKRRKREEEEKRAREEKEKKEKSQLRLGDFFKKASTPKKEKQAEPVKSPDARKEVEDAASEALVEYKKRFRPFNLKPDTRLACSSFSLDERAKDDRGKLLDEYVRGEREVDAECAAPLARIFGFPDRPIPRGKQRVPVKQILEQLSGSAESSRNLSGDGLKKALEGIPLKYLSFCQDVRPPYIGTVTFRHPGLKKSEMAKVARRPTGKRLPLQYDYDSEAEWQDEEEGEDVDMDEDEDEVDDEDDMGDFVDDTDDSGLLRRVFLSDMEPISTGVCFENEFRQGPKETLNEYRMEFITDGLEHTWGIDPFASCYWESPLPKVKKPGANTSNPVGMPPPAAPTNAPPSLPGAASSSGNMLEQAAPPKLPKPDVLQGIRDTILVNRDLTKTGLQDVIFARYKADGLSRAEVKTAFEWLAEKQGQGKAKAWVIKSGR